MERGGSGGPIKAVSQHTVSENPSDPVLSGPQTDGTPPRKMISLLGTSEIPIRLNPDSINAISGAAAGLLAGVVVCPLDVAKTKLQAQAGFASLTSGGGHRMYINYKGMMGTLAQTYQEENIRGLYRGLVPIVIGYMPTWTIYFFLYEKTKRIILDSPNLHYLSNYPSAAHVLSAVAAGSVSTSVTNPIWVIKTRLMSQNAQSSWKQYSGTWDAMKSMFREEGMRAFYSGLGPALLGLGHVAVQFPLYERFKTVFAQYSSDTTSHHTLGIIVASALSKLIASTATYPHEVLRTRSQISVHNNKYKGIIRTIRTIYLEEGIRGFYAGLGTTLFRAIPSSVVTICTYEGISKYLTRYENEHIDQQLQT